MAEVTPQNRMTHYPPWIALAVLSAAFAAVNVIGVKHGIWTSTSPFSGSSIQLNDIQWRHGWPQAWGNRDTTKERAKNSLGSLARMFDHTPLHWEFESKSKVDRARLAVDLLIALAVIAGAVFQFTKIKAKLSLQAAFAMTAIVGAACLTLRYTNIDELLRDARNVALFIIPVAIGLACLSGLNLVGWMYGTIKKR